MPGKTFQCTVTTPEAQVYDGQVESVVIPAHDGELGILHNHAPLLCKLGPGPMRVRRDGMEKSWYVDGGFAQVLENRVTVLTPSALRPGQIARAQAQAELAEARQMKVTDELSERRRAEMVARAQARLRIAAG